MWAGGDASESSPSEFRASQMNVVLHLGKEVKASDARVRFDGLIRFAQRYPSRIIVLCPRDSGSDQMTAKLFSQCYIGSSHREMLLRALLLIQRRVQLSLQSGIHLAGVTCQHIIGLVVCRVIVFRVFY